MSGTSNEGIASSEGNTRDDTEDSADRDASGGTNW